MQGIYEQALTNMRSAWNRARPAERMVFVLSLLIVTKLFTRTMPSQSKVSSMPGTEWIDELNKPDA